MTFLAVNDIYLLKKRDMDYQTEHNRDLELTEHDNDDWMDRENDYDYDLTDAIVAEPDDSLSMRAVASLPTTPSLVNFFQIIPIVIIMKRLITLKLVLCTVRTCYHLMVAVTVVKQLCYLATK
jgi:hypothetical protein